jgi:hypothetical protein
VEAGRLILKIILRIPRIKMRDKGNLGLKGRQSWF